MSGEAPPAGSGDPPTGPPFAATTPFAAAALLGQYGYQLGAHGSQLSALSLDSQPTAGMFAPGGAALHGIASSTAATPGLLQRQPGFAPVLDSSNPSGNIMELLQMQHMLQQLPIMQQSAAPGQATGALAPVPVPISDDVLPHSTPSAASGDPRQDSAGGAGGSATAAQEEPGVAGGENEDEDEDGGGGGGKCTLAEAITLAAPTTPNHRSLAQWQQPHTS